MKLKRFNIQDYRVLQQLKLNFERSKQSGNKRPGSQGKYTLDFLAGVNGTGKSTVLHLLGRLFVWLEQDYRFPVPIELEYELQDGTLVNVSNIPLEADGDADTDEKPATTSDLQLRFKIAEPGQAQDQAITWKDLPTGQKLTDRYLPRHVVMYTTGSEQAWQELLRSEIHESTTPVVEDQTEELPLPSDEQPEVAEAVPEELSEPEATNLPESDNTDQLPQSEDAGSEVREDETPERRFIKELPGWVTSQDLTDVDGEDEFEIAERMLFINSSRLPLVALCGLLASRIYTDHSNADDEVLHAPLRSLDIGEMVGFSLRCRIHKGLIDSKQQETVEELSECANRVIRQGADTLLVFDVSKHKLPSEAKDDDHQKSIFTLYDTPLRLFQKLNSLYEHKPYQDAPLQEVNLFLRRSVQNGADQQMLHLWGWLSDGERSFLARMALFALFRQDDILILLDEPEVHFNDVWKRQIVNMLHQIMCECDSHALITTHSSIALTDVPREDILVMHRSGGHTHPDSGAPPNIQTLGADPSDIIVHVFGTRHASGERSIRYIQEEILNASNDREKLEQLKNIIAPGYWRYRVQLELEYLQARTP